MTALRAAHEAFLERWEHAEPIPGDALPQLLLLIGYWGAAIRGLPAACLDDDWPAP